MVSDAEQPETLPVTVSTLTPGSSVAVAAPDPKKLMRTVNVPLWEKKTRPLTVAVAVPTSLGLAKPDAVPLTETVDEVTTALLAGDVKVMEQAHASAGPSDNAAAPAALVNQCMADPPFAGQARGTRCHGDGLAYGASDPFGTLAMSRLHAKLRFRETAEAR